MRRHDETRSRPPAPDPKRVPDSDAIKAAHQPVPESSDAILLADLSGTILYVNAALEALSGFDRIELLGQPTAMLAGAGAAAFHRESPRPLNAGRHGSGELPDRTKDVQPFAAEWSLAPMVDATGNVVVYVGIARDRSTERALEARLRQMTKMEAVGRLAGGIAHDFNNLLGGIRGYTELVAGSLPDTDPRRTDLDQVLRAATPAAELTRQLLAFSRRQVLQPLVIDPARTLEEIAPLLRRLLGEDILLVVTAAPDLSRVKADPGQLEQVIVNLAVNARDAMPAGGRLAIELANIELDRTFTSVHQEVPAGRYVALAVSDTGVGMDAETISHAFEPFFTTKASQGGTGLGLASVYGIVKQSGGFVYVTSESGGGTTFTIYLPQVTALAPIKETAPADEPMTHGSASVLLVEDDAAVREFMRRVLDGLGYSVVAVGTAAEALALASESDRSIDLLIADVVMPDARGPGLAAHLRTGRPDLGVLLVSGYGEDALAMRGELESGVAFLAKPFSGADLARRVHELLVR